MNEKKQNQNTSGLQTLKEKVKKNKILELILCSMIGIGVSVWVSPFLVSLLMNHRLGFFDNVHFYSGNSDKRLAVLAISYQVIFLTTTLLTGLSDKSETIYWERFTELVLVDPYIWNFRGMSCMAFWTLAVETIAYFFKESIGPEVFYCSFMLGIIIIVLMSAKMSSIYFYRNYFLKRLKRRNPKPNYDKLVKLKENTIVAAQSQNGRIVKENLEWFRDFFDDKSISNDKSISDDKNISDDVTKVMLELFDGLAKQQDCYGYMDLIVDCLVGATKTPDAEISYNVVLWIMQDPVRISIWDKCIERIKRLDKKPDQDIFYEILEKYKGNIVRYIDKKFKDRINKSSCKPVEDNNEESFKKEILTVRKEISKYEENVCHAVDFMLTKRREIELEKVLEIFLVGYDCKCQAEFNTVW